MVNHEGKANRRFQRRVQVRIGASNYAIYATVFLRSIRESDFTLAAEQSRLRNA
jgi:hypothetical protein